MKLYATVTSERASKGQGGEWLDIKVTNSKKETILLLLISPEGSDEDGDVIHASLKTADSVFLGKIGDIKGNNLPSDSIFNTIEAVARLKGNKQKGEHAEYHMGICKGTICPDCGQCKYCSLPCVK